MDQASLLCDCKLLYAPARTHSCTVITWKGRKPRAVMCAEALTLPVLPLPEGIWTE